MISLAVNPEFKNWKGNKQLEDGSEFCNGWFVEIKTNSSYELSPLRGQDSGVEIKLRTGESWLRLWQPIIAPPGALADGYAMVLNTPSKAGSSSSILKWIALLEVEDNGFRVMHKTLLKGPIRLMPGSRIIREFEHNSLISSKPLLLALDFVGGPGEVSIESLDIQPRRIKNVSSGEITKPSKVCVVSWDVSHNPVGRAFLIADMADRDHKVELVGPAFKSFGGRLWPPIADTLLSIRSFPASDMISFLRGAVEIARNTRCDIVHVGKPRLPSLLLGHLIRCVNKCPMVVDIDDDELAFLDDNRPADFVELLAAAKADAPDFDIPYGQLWTRFCANLLDEVEYLTVCNPPLLRRYGGALLRHARDESVFDPKLYDRERTRLEFGYYPQDRVILFLGTPRAHKGLLRIAEAMGRIAEPNLTLCIIGDMADSFLSDRLQALEHVRITFHANQPWDRTPELVNMADAVIILQDENHPISAFQTPAKLSDALAMGIPVIACTVPPLEDINFAGAYIPVANDGALDLALRKLAIAGLQQQGIKGRNYFQTEMSYAINVPRLNSVYQEAACNPLKPTPTFDRIISLLTERSGIRLSPSGRRGPLLKTERQRDLIFLWKQNDSDIYGRRSDMISKYLLETGKVRRVIHFDSPISWQDLLQQKEASCDSSAHQGEAIYHNVCQRHLKKLDAPNFLRRTFLHRGSLSSAEAFGNTLPSPGEYTDFIRSVKNDEDVQDDPLLWVSPLVYDYPLMIEIFKPRLLIADLIDDQRKFPGSGIAYRQRAEEGYDAILRDADMIFSNCQSIKDAFMPIRSDIRVVPNGCEVNMALNVPHREIQSLPRPIIGYVGNLRDRINWPLIERIALEYQNGSIVLVGSSHGRSDALHISQRHKNVHLLGVRSYPEAKSLMKGFDVAIIPHIRGELSNMMNPLKLYVYFAEGLQIVSTNIENIDELSPYILVADDDEEFLAHLKAVTNGWHKPMLPALREYIVDQISWETRVNQLWSMIQD